MQPQRLPACIRVAIAGEYEQHQKDRRELAEYRDDVECVPRRAKSPERQALLLVALEALTRAEAASELIQVGGMVTVTQTTKAVHLNPLVKLERENRALFARIWDQLHLDWSQIDARIV